MAQRYSKKKKHHILGRTAVLFAAVAASALAVYALAKNLSCAGDTVSQSLYPLKYSRYVDSACERYGLDKALVYAVIRTESGFDPNAESRAGARGLMQIMPDSFSWLQDLREEKLESSMLLDPETNIDYGCYLLDYFRDYYDDMYTAVAAYNAGFKVGEWLNDSRYSSDGKTLEAIPYEETSNYVKKVKNAEKMYNKLYFSSK